MAVRPISAHMITTISRSSSCIDVNELLASSACCETKRNEFGGMVGSSQSLWTVLDHIRSLQWHLGGGPGGISHFMEHLMPPLAGMIGILSAPSVTDSLKQSVVEGVLHEAGGRSVDQLSKQENEVLRGLLTLRARPGL